MCRRYFYYIRTSFVARVVESRMSVFQKALVEFAGNPNSTNEQFVDDITYQQLN